MVLSGGHMFYIGKKVKLFTSETTMHRALIFNMYHHLVKFFQVCSNYATGARNGPAPCHMFYIGKKFLPETTRHRALIFGMYHHLG